MLMVTKKLKVQHFVNSLKDYCLFIAKYCFLRLSSWYQLDLCEYYFSILTLSNKSLTTLTSNSLENNSFLFFIIFFTYFGKSALETGLENEQHSAILENVNVILLPCANLANQ